jgi:hypothetical protein
MTQDELKQLVSYDPETGVFIWKRNGNVAGYPKTNGYWQVRINNKYYLMHRLAWLYVHGEFPAQIDHINRIRNDNRLCNLREVTRCQNQQNRSLQSNNTSGMAGVVYSKKYNSWRARIKANNKYYHLGSFKSFDEAVVARINAQTELHKGEE